MCKEGVREMQGICMGISRHVHASKTFAVPGAGRRATHSPSALKTGLSSHLRPPAAHDFLPTTRRTSRVRNLS